MSVPLPCLRNQILSLKVVELGIACARLQVLKTGRKVALQSRLLSYVGEEPVDAAHAVQPADDERRALAVHVITEVFCAANEGVYVQPSLSLAPPDAIPVPAEPELDTMSTNVKTVRCICNQQHQTAIIRCRECGVWQHRACMGITAFFSQPPRFYCDQCRTALADPFWALVESKVISLNVIADCPSTTDQYGSHPVHGIEFEYYLRNEGFVQQARAEPSTHRMQLGCLLLNDPVQCRFHWPRYVQLRVNSTDVRVYSRSIKTKMGINQRDAPASIAALCTSSRTHVRLMMADSDGPYVMVLQRTRKRDVEAVKSMMAAPETQKEALDRVIAQFSSGEDVLISHHVASLDDVYTGQRIKTPARFINASGLQPFDLDAFLTLAKKNRKWQDPVTMTNSTIRQLQVDTYFQCILQCCAKHPHIHHIEIDTTGKWRPQGMSQWFSIFDSPDEIEAALSAAPMSSDDESESTPLPPPAHLPKIRVKANKRVRHEEEVIDLISM